MNAKHHHTKRNDSGFKCTRSYLVGTICFGVLVVLFSLTVYLLSNLEVRHVHSQEAFVEPPTRHVDRILMRNNHRADVVKDWFDMLLESHQNQTSNEYDNQVLRSIIYSLIPRKKVLRLLKILYPPPKSFNYTVKETKYEDDIPILLLDEFNVPFKYDLATGSRIYLRYVNADQVDTDLETLDSNNVIKYASVINGIRRKVLHNKKRKNKNITDGATKNNNITDVDIKNNNITDLGIKNNNITDEGVKNNNITDEGNKNNNITDEGINHNNFDTTVMTDDEAKINNSDTYNNIHVISILN